MQGSFSSQILADKLAKLNSSQQSIETLSHWCIFHRRSAKQVVDIWEREFFAAPREQRVPFLFLANDILQNSRRKGAEFVTEFWRVLSGALRDVMRNGDEGSRSTVLRLVDIWEERRVFGSHAQGLRVEFLGKDAPPSAKSSDGLLPEKLVAVYKAFHDKLAEEEVVIDKCNTAVIHMESLEKDIDVAAASGQESSAIVLDELQHQENVLLQCIQRLEASEIARSSIVFQLKEALQDQEAKLERTRLLLQAAHTHAEQARIMQQQIYDALSGQPFQQPEEATANGSDEGLLDQYEHVSRAETAAVPGPLMSTETEGYVPHETSRFDPAAAAEVAAKLAASTSSAAVLSSVLSSLAAENVVTPLHTQNGLEANDGEEPQEKKQKLDDHSDSLPDTDAPEQPEHLDSSQAPTQYLDPSMLLPYSFAGPSLTFPPVSSQSVPPGCAPETYQQLQSTALSFLLPTSSATVPRE